MSRDELIESFSLEGISGGNAVFDTEKLDWMNGQYIARLSTRRAGCGRSSRCSWRPACSAPVSGRRTPWLHRLLELLRPRAKRLTDFVELARPFLVGYGRVRAGGRREAPARSRISRGTSQALAARSCATLDPFDEPHVEAAVRGTAAERGIKAGVLIHATRVAVTGRTTSPGLFEVLVLLGRERTVAGWNGSSTFLPRAPRPVSGTNR